MLEPCVYRSHLRLLVTRLRLTVYHFRRCHKQHNWVVFLLRFLVVCLCYTYLDHHDVRISQSLCFDNMFTLRCLLARDVLVVYLRNREVGTRSHSLEKISYLVLFRPTGLSIWLDGLSWCTEKKKSVSVIWLGGPFWSPSSQVLLLLCPLLMPPFPFTHTQLAYDFIYECVHISVDSFIHHGANSSSLSPCLFVTNLIWPRYKWFMVSQRNEDAACLAVGLVQGSIIQQLVRHVCGGCLQCRVQQNAVVPFSWWARLHFGIEILLGLRYLASVQCGRQWHFSGSCWSKRVRGKKWRKRQRRKRRKRTAPLEMQTQIN